MKECDDGSRDEEALFEETDQLTFPPLEYSDLFDREGYPIYPDFLDLKVENNDLLEEYLDELADVGNYDWVYL